MLGRTRTLVRLVRLVTLVTLVAHAAVVRCQNVTEDTAEVLSANAAELRVASSDVLVEGNFSTAHGDLSCWFSKPPEPAKLSVEAVRESDGSGVICSLSDTMIEMLLQDPDVQVQVASNSSTSAWITVEMDDTVNHGPSMVKSAIFVVSGVTLGVLICLLLGRLRGWRTGDFLPGTAVASSGGPRRDRPRRSKSDITAMQREYSANEMGYSWNADFNDIDDEFDPEDNDDLEADANVASNSAQTERVQTLRHR
mmetsp:Transcript_4146/g.12473  ORF Transcript_4146/g.12473 Transcript_4146/m.12473 type:complete len:253 (+) Transcript_4146:145-903(+)